MSTEYCFYCEKAFHKLLPAVGRCDGCGKRYCADHGRMVMARPPRWDRETPDGEYAIQTCLQCAVQHDSHSLIMFQGNCKDNTTLYLDTPDAEYFACYLCLGMQGKIVLTDRYCIACKKPVCEGVHGRFMPRPHKAVGGPFFCLSCSTKQEASA